MFTVPASPVPRSAETLVWLRLGARLVDACFIYSALMVYFVIFVVLAATGGLESPPAPTWFLLLGLLSALLFFGFLVYNLVQQVRTGQTVGKKLLRLRVVRMNGEPRTYGRVLFLREIVPGLVAILPLIGTVAVLANLLAIFGAESRCLHDRLADTRVIDALE